MDWINWDVTTMAEAIESAQSVWSPYYGDYNIRCEDIEHACCFLSKIANGATYTAEGAPRVWLALEVLGLNASTTPPTFREGANYRFVPEDICGLRLYRPLRISSIAERLLKVEPYMIAAEMKGE